MFVQPVCAEEILFHIDMLDNKKSNDTYDIPGCSAILFSLPGL